MNDVMQSIIGGLATHKLVPFFGAGVSAAQLHVDWQSITDSMADEMKLLPAERGGFLEISERYYATVGAERFAAFLRSYLIVDSFDEISAWPHLFLLSLNTGLLYTTNQDNIFELAAVKYGRPHRVIARVEDLAKAASRDNLIIKYHGDLDRPETVIFTETSYRERISNKRHFLNIRLQSDLLSKGFLFIGYSLRDPNIRVLFQELNEAFGGQLPLSYLIAYHYEPSLEHIARDFGVVIVNPREHITDARSDGEAFQRFLSVILEAVNTKKHTDEVNYLFAPATPRSIRVATVYDVDSLIKISVEFPFVDALERYRSMLDRTMVPDTYADRALTAFTNICEKAKNDNDLRALHGAIFNMTLPRCITMHAIQWAMVAINRCSTETGFPNFMFLCPQHPSVVTLAGTMLAIAYLRDNRIKVTAQFRRHAEFSASSFKSLPEELKQSAHALYEWAWQDGGMRFPKHVIEAQGAFVTPTFEDIMQSITGMFPERA